MSPVTRLLPDRLKGSLPYRLLRAVYRCIVDGDLRARKLLQMTRPTNYFQPYTTTTADRYPLVFQFARDQLGDHRSMRILSVGCSTGDEVFSLRRYFPTAAIHGIDINSRNISICRNRVERSGDAGMTFEVADSTRREGSESCAAIFCMAVLRHGDLEAVESPRCDHLIRFADFDRMVCDFARCLKPGGLLFIWQSNFRFCDSNVSPLFDVALRMERVHARLYDRNNTLMKGTDDTAIGFRKRIDAP
ncbi:MAG TPA: class I SAM-dependent methyltransferase [Vicinamibacterales bacterium]|nr:class I SAM-dependent methyltransferase [Vicinamibacterales bacterium]